MPDYFVYLDESGTLDFGENVAKGESVYFGVGSATYPGEHSEVLWDAHVLRASLESRGISIPGQLHAKNDSWETRKQVLSLINSHAPRFDATFLRKDRAQPHIRRAGKTRLYKMAMYLHVKYLCEQVFKKDDSIYLVVANIGTAALKAAAQEGLRDIAAQMPQEVVLCCWDSASSWGLQSSDYLLWALQREINRKTPIEGHDELVTPLVKSTYFPWGN